MIIGKLPITFIANFYFLTRFNGQIKAEAMVKIHYGLLSGQKHRKELIGTGKLYLTSLIF
jgi:hypothetical protein